MLKLIPPSTEQINEILKIYFSSEGNKMNNSLSNLFTQLNNIDKYEILIKAVSINQIYSTAILNIFPVVEKIFANTESLENYSTNDYVELVDKITKVEWIDKNNKMQKRNNLSFSSKYVHFLSGRNIPIYDSYVWILITGYLNQNSLKKIRTNQPRNYKEFYSIYNNFVATFNLDAFDVYKIDKYLWQYCDILLTQISKDKNVQQRNKAKAILRKEIKEGE